MVRDIKRLLKEDGEVLVRIPWGMRSEIFPVAVGSKMRII